MLLLSIIVSSLISSKGFSFLSFISLSISSLYSLYILFSFGVNVLLLYNLFIFINNKSYAEKPQVKTFVQFYLDKVAELAREVVYIPLSDYSAEKAKLK